MDEPGMLRMQLRPDGRLFSLETTALPQHDRPAKRPVAWSVVLALAGLEIAGYQQELRHDALQHASSLTWTALAPARR